MSLAFPTWSISGNPLSTAQGSYEDLTLNMDIKYMEVSSVRNPQEIAAAASFHSMYLY